MSYKIEPVFVLFPLACLLFWFFGLGNKRFVKYLIAISFILLYSFSLNGSDFEGYRVLYRGVKEGASASSLHGELGYYYLVKLFITLGSDYITFRIVLLTFCSLILFFCISKMSDNFALSMFFLSSMFIVYMISAYRQYIVIVISIWSIYNYDQGRRILSVLVLISLLFFHITAVLPLGIVICHEILSERKKTKQLYLFQKHYVIILSVALLMRIIIALAMTVDPFKSIVEKIVEGHASAKPTLFSFGLVSRIAMFICVSYIYRRSWVYKTDTQILYWYYFLSIILYVIVPLEFTMGRLINNANILLAILIPALRFQYSLKSDHFGVMRMNGITSILIMSVFVASVVLVNQLYRQDGYTPYLNYLRGDEPVIFKVEEDEEETQNTAPREATVTVQ